MLVAAAKEAGIKVPKNPDGKFDAHKYPHFQAFCNIQLNRPMFSFSEHWDNAKVLAKFSVKKLKRLTIKNFIKAGGRVVLG